MSLIIRIIDNWIAKDDKKERDDSLGEIQKTWDESSDYTPKKGNKFLRLLNENIVKLNYWTAVSSKLMLVLTFAIFIVALFQVWLILLR